MSTLPWQSSSSSSSSSTPTRTSSRVSSTLTPLTLLFFYTLNPVLILHNFHTSIWLVFLPLLPLLLFTHTSHLLHVIHICYHLNACTLSAATHLSINADAKGVGGWTTKPLTTIVGSSRMTEPHRPPYASWNALSNSTREGLAPPKASGSPLTTSDRKRILPRPNTTTPTLTPKLANNPTRSAAALASAETQLEPNWPWNLLAPHSEHQTGAPLFLRLQIEFTKEYEKKAGQKIRKKKNGLHGRGPPWAPTQNVYLGSLTYSTIPGTFHLRGNSRRLSMNM